MADAGFGLVLLGRAPVHARNVTAAGAVESGIVRISPVDTPILFYLTGVRGVRP